MITQAARPLPERTTTTAAVWLNGRHATVARTGLDGEITTVEVDRGVEPETSYLVRVVRLIGDRERVLILGPSSPRLALEREYVAVFKRPDHLVDVEAAGETDPTALVQRLTTLLS